MWESLLLTASFVYQLFVEKNQALLLIHSILLALFLFGTPQLIYGTLRYSWTWKHIGIIDYIQRHGSINPAISTLGGYQNWPGFFILGVLINETAGFQSALSYAGWGPVFFNILDIGAVVFIFRSLVTDERIVWAGVWVFLLGNWIGQDYFSPQAMAFFFYLVTLGIILRWFRSRSTPFFDSVKKWLRFNFLANIVHQIFVRSTASLIPEEKAGKLQLAGLMVILVMMFAVLVSSHQLTPFMLISALVFLSIFNINRVIRLPVLLASLTTIWLIFFAVDFLQANTSWIVKSIGLLIFNSRYIVVNAKSLSPNQSIVAEITRLLSAGVVLLAVAGLLRRLKNNHWDLPSILLMISPIPLLAANSYGGEMRLRVYYFALPFMAFFAAGLFFPVIKAGKSIFTRLALFFVIVAMVGGFCFSAYGREQMNYFSPEEVQASTYLIDNAPAGSAIVDLSWDWPKYFKDYENYTYVTLIEYFNGSKQKLLNNPVTEIAGVMKRYKTSYLILTRSEAAQIDMLHYLKPGSLQKIETDLLKSPQFKVFYQNSDAVIITLNQPAASTMVQPESVSP